MSHVCDVSIWREMGNLEGNGRLVGIDNENGIVPVQC
jgi:hypothetical protein